MKYKSRVAKHDSISEKVYSEIFLSLKNLSVGTVFLSNTATKVRISILNGIRPRSYFTIPIQDLVHDGIPVLSAKFSDFVSQVYSFRNLMRLSDDGVKSVTMDLEADGGKEITEEIRFAVMTAIRDFATSEAVETRRDVWRRKTCMRNFIKRVEYAHQESYLTHNDMRLAIKGPEDSAPPRRLKRDGDKMVWGNLNFWSSRGVSAGLKPVDFERVLNMRIVKSVIDS